MDVSIIEIRALYSVMTKVSKNTATVKRIARELGFDFVGISKAEKLEEEEANLIQWLNKGHHGSMNYMTNHFEKRLDPTLLVEGSKSVVSLMYNYYTPNIISHPMVRKHGIFIKNNNTAWIRAH